MRQLNGGVVLSKGTPLTRLITMLIGFKGSARLLLPSAYYVTRATSPEISDHLNSHRLCFLLVRPGSMAHCWFPEGTAPLIMGRSRMVNCKRDAKDREHWQ